MVIRCKICGKQPKDIPEYADNAKVEGISPDEYVIEEEGTYNGATGKFYCTSCYVKAGMPLGKA